MGGARMNAGLRKSTGGIVGARRDGARGRQSGSTQHPASRIPRLAADASSEMAPACSAPIDSRRRRAESLLGGVQVRCPGTPPQLAATLSSRTSAERAQLRAKREAVETTQEQPSTSTVMCRSDMVDPGSVEGAAPLVRSCGCAHRFPPGQTPSPVRERRRSRSSCSLPDRSRTPSSVSTDRATPPPGPLYRLRCRTMSEEVLDVLPDEARPASTPLPPHRFRASCWFSAQPVPVRFSSSVELRLGCTRRRYKEAVLLKTRLAPRRHAETAIALVSPASRRFTTSVEIQCLAPVRPQDPADSHSDA
ncbi:uncharacterized protein LOC134540347 [Bacillus rossius redtenbacheri]|uniref:uncharacterized protein LOC134540347 n=1 Tax=Bacillus rossius redtenbacheri TaxID=93214 RepID=UPI002FDD64A1